MKKLVYSIALLGLVVMAACSGDSPTAQPVPTVVPDEWAISSLTVSDPNPDIGATILVEAEVQKNGVDAPDGTAVEFLASGGQFVNGTTEASVNTVGGHAAVQFTAAAPGNYLIQARVRAVTRQVAVTYRDPDTDEDLVIHLPLIPNVGSYDGGETVFLRGTGIRSPAEVIFDVEGALFPAIVVEVIESNPLSGPGQIEVQTPFIDVINRTEDRIANVIVRRGVGTASEQTVTLPSAFTFMEVTSGGPPVIYVLEPNFGRSAGGDQVNVLGRNLETVTRTTFTFRGAALIAEILAASPDGLQMEIVTPRFSAVPLDVNELADFTATNPSGDSTLTQAFTVIADDPTPEIASLSPIAGPLGGGTLVSIFGSGFKVPVQVRFGNLTATDVNVIDDQSPADQDVITCLSPDYSHQGQVPPVVVEVTVTNMTSGKISNARQFTYGDNLFISGNSPTDGRPGDQVVIYGAGFEDPLQAFFTVDNIELEVQSVSGTEVLVRFPPDLAVTCSDRTGQFRVKLIDSNQEATGGTFTLRGNQPTVTGVEPTFVQADASGNYVNPSDITVFGADFSETLLVKIADYVMATSAVTVVDESTIEVTGIPAPNEFGLVFDTTPCITGDGVPGLREVPTPVDVTVVNLPGNCGSTLAGGLIYEPGDDECVASATIIAPAPVFPAAQAGSCSTADLVVSNGGAGTLEVYQMNLMGRFYFDSGATNQSSGGFTVAPYGTGAPIPIYFCPDLDNGGAYVGELIIQNSSPTTPYSVPLSGSEESRIWSVNQTDFVFPDTPVAGGAAPHPTPLTITNSGTGTLTWTLVKSGTDPDRFFIQEGAADRFVPPMSSKDFHITFDPNAVGAFSAILTITANESDAQPMSVEITVSGNGV